MTNITKVSNVISVKQDSNLPKSYFGAVGNFSTVPNYNTFVINIGADCFEIKLSDLRVNGATITTMSQGVTMLSAVFGS